MRDRGVGGFVFGHRSKPAAATETLLSQGKKKEEKKIFFSIFSSAGFERVVNFFVTKIDFFIISFLQLECL